MITTTIPLPRDIPLASHNLGLASYLVTVPSILRQEGDLDLMIHISDVSPFYWTIVFIETSAYSLEPFSYCLLWYDPFVEVSMILPFVDDTSFHGLTIGTFRDRLS